ncbi:MAG TPA: TetR/AcrR family transcriptional regulator [Syntrophomonadaceae bacterium]|nr:TetR/AcrR family transcriptional regulator [Syntrophomonadaceae bacterium]HQE23135.1 TetR/AcrR family transcriptional regulator [Syntrophomonadaceae bacterium]
MSHDNNNREKILAAARILMAEKGIKKTSLADIARAVGISKGTLFYHFASKDDLVNDILADHFTNLVDIAKAHLPQHLKNNNPAQILKMIFEQFTNDLDITRLDLYLLQEGIQGNENINQKFLERKRYWRKVIADDLETVFGITDPVYSSALGAMLLAIIDGLALQILVEPGSVNLEEISSTLAEMITLLASAESHQRSSR